MQHLSILVRPTDDAGWTATVQQMPSLQAVGKTHDEALINAQVIALRWMAEQIEQRSLPPIEFSIARETQKQTYGLAYQKAVALLDSVSFLGDQPKDQRLAVMKSIAAVQELLATMGISGRLTTPFMQLVAALRDLEHGTVDPILEPSPRPQNKPPDPSRSWVVRAGLAIALEARYRLGMTLSEAADLVANDAHQLGLRVAGAKREHVPPAGRIVQLRKDLMSHRAGPGQGLHILIWDSFLRLAQKIDAELEPMRTEQLEQLYSAAMTLAASRGVLTMGGNTHP